jgi:hypothetical protein
MRERSREVNIKHSMYGTRIYNIWRNMVGRCHNPNSDKYKYYGGRGITVCEEWHGFQKFYDDMASTYQDNLTIDRIDNNAPYSKGNCQWVTMLEQSNNRRSNRVLTVKGITDTLANLCRIYNVDYDLVSSRINSGKWSIDEAFFTPKYGRMVV